jgi:hypothetical protein
VSTLDPEIQKTFLHLWVLSATGKRCLKIYFLCNRDLTAPNGDKFNVIL